MMGSMSGVGVDRFADLLVADPEWLDAEFDAIIGANWPARRMGFPPAADPPPADALRPRRWPAAVVWPAAVLRSAVVVDSAPLRSRGARWERLGGNYPDRGAAQAGAPALPRARQRSQRAGRG